MANSKLFVGGLPYTTTEAQLESLFSEYGTVESVRVVTDRMTGRSRGFGFVEMSSQAEAEEAARQINGSQLEGRTLKVDEAKPRNSGPRNPGSNRRW